jgi:transposase
MCVRANRRRKDGKDHTYWSLVETIRTAAGPRQRTICYLGELNSAAEVRWRKTVRIFNAQGEEQQLALFPAGTTPSAGDAPVVEIRLDRVRWTRPRDFGDVWLGWHLWQRLGLDGFCETALDGVPAEVPWSRIAAVLAINRLCAPGSELAIEARWYATTALDEVLGIDAARGNTDRLYRCLDLLLPHKVALERHLAARYGELFGVQYELLLYDLTSTYVEGEAAGNLQMRRGYSRDHRPDCKQVVLALVVSPEGFPLAYEVFDGNRTDVTTLDEILAAVEAKYGQAQRVWVLDRGIVSERNLATLRARGAHYLVGTPRARLRAFERELLAGEWQHVRETVEVQLIPSRDGTETFVLCRSAMRREQEQAMRRLASQRLEQALERLAAPVAERPRTDPDWLHERIGRLKERYARVARLYDIRLTGTGSARRLHWQLRPERYAWHEARAGAYLLRTNLTATDPATLWTRYVQLTEVEAAFRALKSELAIRPIWHQKASRVQAHILVAFLGYALWVTLKHTLRAAGAGLSPAQTLHQCRGIKSGDILLETIDGRTLRFRRVSRPDAAQHRLLHALRLALPERLGVDAECSGDSATPPAEHSATYSPRRRLRA